MIILPQIIDRIMITAFYPEGVIRLNRLEEPDFEEIPVLRQVICLCRFIRENNGKLKLTNTGNLPPRVAREIYLAGVTDWYHEKYPGKRILETDAKFVMIARELAALSGIIRKQSNTLVITRKGEKLLPDKQLMLETLIRDFVHRFDLGRYDGYHIYPGLGYRDAGLSLLLFDNVRKQMPGKIPTDMDYAKGYFDIRTGEFDGRKSMRCYLFRTYQNFMELFGLVTTEEKWIMEEVRSQLTIRPTPLADRMIFIAGDYGRFTVKMSPDLKICRLKITLSETDPPVWRRIQVPSSLSLNDLHYLVQYAMGWENAHLHEFEKEGICYTDNVDEELPSVQYDGMVISDLLKNKGDTVLYRYDFGDNWEHVIELEELLSKQEDTDYRVLMDGGRRCPPEDCGGVHGYHQMLKVLNNPDDPEREEYLTWLGGHYNPDALNSQNDFFDCFF